RDVADRPRGKVPQDPVIGGHQGHSQHQGNGQTNPLPERRVPNINETLYPVPIRAAPIAFTRNGPITLPSSAPYAREAIPSDREATTPPMMMHTLYKSGPNAGS